MIFSSGWSGSGKIHTDERTDLRLALAIGLLLLPAHAYAQEEEMVPLYPPEQAVQLARSPIAYMVDSTTCERVEGHRLADGSLAGEGRKGALFRQGKPGQPFMLVTTRIDGVYVARFPANPGEVILSRAYIIDPRTQRVIYGRPTKAKCVAGKAEVGALVPAKD